MTQQRVLIDPAVPLLALGGTGSQGAACLNVMTLIGQGRLEAWASVLLVQEVMSNRLRRTDNPEAAAAAGEYVMELVKLVAFDQGVLEASIDLVRSGRARGRYAIHAASALAAGIPVIITPDTDFDGIPGLTRLDPKGVDGWNWPGKHTRANSTPGRGMAEVGNDEARRDRALA